MILDEEEDKGALFYKDSCKGCACLWPPSYRQQIKRLQKRSPYIPVSAPKRQRFSSFEQENLHSVPRSAWLKLLDPHPPPPSKLGQWVESSGEKESLVCMTVGSLYQSETQCLEGETEARIFRRILLAEQPSRTGVSSSDRNSFIKVDQMILCHSC